MRLVDKILALIGLGVFGLILAGAVLFFAFR